MTRIKEETRPIGVIEWLDSALRDARHGMHQLRRTPVLALAVVVSLAVGLGANTAIFSIVDAAILKPLPVANPDALVIIEWTNEGFPPGIENHNGEYTPIAGGRRQGSSIAAHLYRHLAREQTVFEPLMGIAAYPDAVAIAADTSPAQQASLQYVSGNFFQGLGVRPVLGRPFRDDEDRVGGEPVVIVSHRFWVSRLGGGGDALNRKVRVNNVPARIVGVAPPGFENTRLLHHIRLATGTSRSPTVYGGFGSLSGGGSSMGFGGGSSVGVGGADGGLGTPGGVFGGFGFGGASGIFGPSHAALRRRSAPMVATSAE